MKPVLLTGSPMLLYAEPRRIPTYMAAIIRRHRFVIICTIGFLILMMFSWHFRRRDIAKSNSTPVSNVNENSKNEIQILDSNKQYMSDIAKIPNNIDVEQPLFINNIGKPPKDKGIFPFVELMTKKESTLYQVEEFRHLFHIKQNVDEFTTKYALMIDEEKRQTIPTLKKPKIKSPSPSKVDIVTETKYLNSEVSSLKITHGNKLVSPSAIRQPEDDIPAPDQENKLQKKEVTFPIAKNKTDPKGLLKVNKPVSPSNVREHEEEFPAPDQENKGLKKDVTFPMAKNITDTIDVLKIKKPVSLSDVRQPEEDFPAPYEDNKWVIKDVTFPMPRNITDTIDVLKINEDVKLNQRKSIPINSNITNVGKNPILLIDTPGCKIPKLDPWDPTVKDLIELRDPYVCPGPPVFMQSNPGGSIIYNKTILETYYNITPEELICYYEPIYRTYEGEVYNREISFTTGNVGQLMFGVPLNEDYVSVSCNIKGKKYEQYFPLVRLKKDVEAEKNLITPPNPTMNVILLGIDSVSKLNFLRHFPRTHAFLKEKLKPFEMNGYTKVADNTFPNLVPLLTGQFVERWWNETVRDTMFFDDVDFIWKAYAMRGYRTFFAEDNPFAGSFNFNKKGFHNPPTDYYFRPLALALEMWKVMTKPEKDFCLNSQIDYDMIYDYLKVFVQTMETRPYFGFAMLSTITHDKLNNAGWADEPTKRLLEGLLDTGALNNTMLVLFSDHGLRFGKIRQTYIGKFEERLPLMYIHIPNWFLDQYPEIAKNMEVNQDRLMTLFDVHATMLHLLDLTTTHDHRSIFTQGRSLFEEITPNRTCPDAYIQTHWCPCQTFDIVDLNSPEAINASQAIVKDINFKLEPYGGVCEVFEVDTIIDARVGKANELMLQYLRTVNEVINKTVYIGDEVTPLDDYMITLVAKPGGGVFEGTVRHNPEDNSYIVLGISRISMYGNTSWCIDSPKMKIFCYCKVQQLT